MKGTYDPAKNHDNRMNPPTMPDDALLTKKRVAKWLNVSTRTVESLMEAGRLPFVKLGHRTVRFRHHHVQNLLETAEAKPQP